MNFWRELVRVRVLFLKPGDRLHPSDFDEGINEFSVKKGNMLWSEDIEEMNVYKISSSDLAEVLSIERGESFSFFGERVATPNDPMVEMRVPTWIMYFDPLQMNPDWGEGGFMGEKLCGSDTWSTFEAYVEPLLEHARALKPDHVDGFGSKVSFTTAWSCYTSQDYWGEWDSGYELIGVCDPHAAPVRPLLTKESNESNGDNRNLSKNSHCCDSDPLRLLDIP